MSIEIQENVAIAPYTTFKLGGRVRYFGIVNDASAIPSIVGHCQQLGLPIVVLGGGSNTIFADGHIDCVVLKIEIKGFDVIEENNSNVVVKIGAGENWDSVVERAVKSNWSGIECLSAIPGTAGATPIQNVGAYGQEIKDVLESVEAYDLRDNKFAVLSAEDCQLTYRNSIFKQEAKGRYIIASITLRLRKAVPTIPLYPGVQQYFEDNKIISPNLNQLREAIIEIRKTKLPDPSVVPNVGSFFKNALIPRDQAEKLYQAYPDMAHFPAADDMVKIPTGWLLDKLGIKGKKYGLLEIYQNNALVVTNPGGATFAELKQLIADLQEQVKQKFDIILEPEPVIVE